MRLPRRSKPQEAASPDDTQEMFAAGGELPDGPVEDQEPEPAMPDGQPGDEASGAEEEFVDPESEEADEAGDLPDEDEQLEELLEEDEWDDAYDEWDEEPDADEGEEGSEDAEETAAGPSRTDDLKAWFAAFRTRTKAIATGLLGRVGRIKLPSHEIDGQKVLAVAGISVAMLMVGAAGYLLGKGSGEDVDTARLGGEFAGKQAGAIAGATEGYAAGFKKGREIAFRKSYAASYRRNYIRAYENAGMDPPDAKRIEVPKP